LLASYDKKFLYRELNYFLKEENNKFERFMRKYLVNKAVAVVRTNFGRLYSL